MTDCPDGEMRDLLPDLLHERLVASERAAVEAHVAWCADCRAELALLRDLRGEMHRVPAVNVASIVGAVPAYRAPAKRTWGGWRAAAAIAAIAVGGTSVAIATRETQTAAPVVVAARETSRPVAPGAQSSASAPLPEPRDASTSASTGSAASRETARELAVAGAVSDLNDSELAALVRDMSSFDALPSVSGDVESTSLAPAAVAPSKEAS